MPTSSWAWRPGSSWLAAPRSSGSEAQAVSAVLWSALPALIRRGDENQRSKQLPGRVEKITRGAATANVAVTVAGMTMTAAITVDAVDELGLKEGSEVLVIIRASDVMLATPD